VIRATSADARAAGDRSSRVGVLSAQPPPRVNSVELDAAAAAAAAAAGLSDVDRPSTAQTAPRASPSQQAARAARRPRHRSRDAVPRPARVGRRAYWPDNTWSPSRCWATSSDVIAVTSRGRRSVHAERVFAPAACSLRATSLASRCADAVGRFLRYPPRPLPPPSIFDPEIWFHAPFQLVSVGLI